MNILGTKLNNERIINKEKINKMDNNIFNTEVTLSGIDGNVFAIFGACIKSARRNNVPQEQVDEFLKEAKQGDYDHVLQTCHKYFDVY